MAVNPSVGFDVFWQSRNFLIVGGKPLELIGHVIWIEMGKGHLAYTSIPQGLQLLQVTTSFGVISPQRVSALDGVQKRYLASVDSCLKSAIILWYGDAETSQLRFL